MVKIMLMVGTVIFICDASSKLMCEITKFFKMKLMNCFGNVWKKWNCAAQSYAEPQKAQKDKLELLGGVLCLAYLCTLLFLIEVLYTVEGEPTHQQVM